jgi:hypothetical protein
VRTLHDPATRSSIEARLKALRPDAPRQWGSMTPDQMLWHLNQFLTFSIEGGSQKRKRPAMAAAMFRFILLYMPWPKGAPTNPKARAQGSHDFVAERERCLALIAKFVSRPLDAQWPEDPSFGEMTGVFASKLQAKHFDHHLRQFNG